MLTANELDLGALLQLSLLLSLLDGAVVGLLCSDLSGNLAGDGLVKLVQHIHSLQDTREGAGWGYNSHIQCTGSSLVNQTPPVRQPFITVTSYASTCDVTNKWLTDRWSLVHETT